MISAPGQCRALLEELALAEIASDDSEPLADQPEPVQRAGRGSRETQTDRSDQRDVRRKGLLQLGRPGHEPHYRGVLLQRSEDGGVAGRAVTERQRLAFEQRDPRVTMRAQPPSGGEPGNSGSDDDGVRIHPY
jgi:hypothetical protein